MEHLERQETLEEVVNQGLLEVQDPPVALDLRDQRVLLVVQVHQGHPDLKDQLDRREALVHQEAVEHREW